MSTVLSLTSASLPKLVGSSNYVDWAWRLENELLEADLLDVVLGENEELKKSTESWKQNVEALVKIRKAVESEAGYCLREIRLASVAWSTLEYHYGKKGRIGTSTADRGGLASPARRRGARRGASGAEGPGRMVVVELAPEANEAGRDVNSAAPKSAVMDGEIAAGGSGDVGNGRRARVGVGEFSLCLVEMMGCP